MIIKKKVFKLSRTIFIQEEKNILKSLLEQKKKSLPAQSQYLTKGKEVNWELNLTHFRILAPIPTLCVGERITMQPINISHDTIYRKKFITPYVKQVNDIYDRLATSSKNS